MRDNIEISVKINREPTHQEPAPTKWGMFARHVERRKFGAVALSQPPVLQSDISVRQVLKWNNAALQKTAEANLFSITGVMKIEKLCTDPHGTAGFPWMLRAGHSLLSSLAHLSSDGRREWGDQARWVSAKYQASETEFYLLTLAQPRASVKSLCQEHQSRP